METIFVSKVSVLYFRTLFMKDKIIHTATDLFLRLGVKSTTMSYIANEMGISKKTIYAHFQSKADLVEKCTFWFLEVIHEKIDAICALDQNPIQELFEIKKYVMNKLNNDQYSPQFQLQKYYPEISQVLQKAQFDLIMDCTKTNIERGMAMNLYRKSIDADFISRLYFIGITGMRDQTLFPPKKFSTTYITDEFLEYHLRGIVTKEGLQVLNKFITEIQPHGV